MAKKDIRALLRKQLAKGAADTVLKKVRKAIKRGATAAKARKVLLDAVRAQAALEIPPAEVYKIDFQGFEGVALDDLAP
jgi:hypothetical protein